MGLKTGYKQTEVGKIPEDWSVLPLRDICKLYNGRAYALHEWETNGVPVIRLQNLTGGNDYYYSNLNLGGLPMKRVSARIKGSRSTVL